MVPTTMDVLVSELEKIKVEAPAMSLPSQKEEVPLSYSTNNSKEKLLLAYADNFQRQFRQLYGDRKPLLLKPVNECGIEKFVCSTLRPTYLPYKELYEYDSCASFVADYLLYETLKIPNELPEKVVSSTLVLKNQKGSCFEYANLLASLLIGVGYDAYCVCGYATQDITLLNQIRKTCPQLNQKEGVSEAAKGDKKGRYHVRPPRDLTSQFEKRQAKKEREKLEDEERKKQEEEAARIAEAEAPPPDSYHGLRIHCWVLVLSGKREVAQSFFIEPSTGEDHPLEWDQYLGIETLWNDKNYWVNMQDCSQGLQNMRYDLGDATQWEFFFPNVEKPLLIVPGEEPDLEEKDKEEEEEDDLKEDFQLPPSWVLPIELSPKDLETRCPRGSKQVLYYRAKLEKFAEYLNQDGLVSRVTAYDDTGRTRKSQVKSIFKHRSDCLETKTENTKIGEVKECFAPGRQRALKEHVHYESNPLRAANRTMLFYSHARVDCLSKRELTSNEMIEHFRERPDYLFYRHTMYSKVPKTKTLGSALTSQDTAQKPILKIVERFHHNPSIPANSDVAERVFLLEENRIRVSYHLEKDRITPSTREFVTPNVPKDQGYNLHFDPEMTTAYQVDPYASEPKNRHLFQQLEALMEAQEKSIVNIRESEKETQAILNNRMQEELNTTLSISVYDVARNEAARTHRRELEQKLAEEERIRKEKEKDYLAPFAARIGDPPTFTKKQMEEVSQDCLKDLRTRLVDMANIIQSRFELETEELQKKQAWYKSKQGSLTKEEEKDYIDFCNDAMFRIHILEQRLNRHKITAPQKYRDLENRLRTDPRLVH